MTKTPETRQCACGCGNTTQSTYTVGHDSQHKSSLINRAIELEKAAEQVEDDPLAGDAEYQEILACLDGRGWRKFLDKTRETRVNGRRREATSPRTTPRKPNDAKSSVLRLAEMRKAYDRLAMLGRACGPNRVLITRANYDALNDSTDAELLALPCAAEQFDVGNAVWFMFKGERIEGKIVHLNGNRARVEYPKAGTKRGVESRTMDVLAIELATA